MKHKNAITFFYSWENDSWSEKTDANKYFGSLSIIIVGLSGALVGGGNTLADWFDWDTKISLIGAIEHCLCLWCLNVGESIIAATKIKTMIFRSLTMLFAMAAAFGLGYVLAIVFIIFVIIFIVELVLAGGINSLKDSLKDGGTKTLKNKETGEEVKVRQDLFGGYADSSGNTYERQMDGTYEKK